MAVRCLHNIIALTVMVDVSSEGMMKGVWMAPGGVGTYPGGYDVVAHFAGEPTWARAHYHGAGMNSIPEFPGDGSEKYKFFTVCGDSCVFDALFMDSYLGGTSFPDMCKELKSKGYNGIMYDFEIFHYSWSTADNQALNMLFRQTQSNGMYSAWTTSAMGPYEDSDGKGVIDIDWDCLDFAVPQMYDAHQNYYNNGLKDYAPWWKNGGESIHHWTLKTGVGRNTLVLWGASTQSAGVNSGIGPETAKAAMTLTGLPGGYIEWTYNCAYPCANASRLTKSDHILRVV